MQIVVWEMEVTDEFRTWWTRLTDSEQASVARL